MIRLVIGALALLPLIGELQGFCSCFNLHIYARSTYSVCINFYATLSSLSLSLSLSLLLYSIYNCSGCPRHLMS